MNIPKNKCLSTQPIEFTDMVTNAKPGDLYIHSYPNSIIFSYDRNGNPQTALFLVDKVEEISTRFGSRDRVLKGWRCKQDKENKNLIKVEKTFIWCSQLESTDKFPGKIKIVKE